MTKFRLCKDTRSDPQFQKSSSHHSVLISNLHRQGYREVKLHVILVYFDLFLNIQETRSSLSVHWFLPFLIKRHVLSNETRHLLCCPWHRGNSYLDVSPFLTTLSRISLLKFITAQNCHCSNLSLLKSLLKIITAQNCHC